MTEPNPLPYASVAPGPTIDLSHLKTLAICHYVWGGIVAAFSSFFIIHVFLGLMMANGRFPSPPGAASPPPPPFFGYMMAGMGGCAVLCGWTWGILTIFSGRSIARQQRRIFSLVMAGINCASVPFGTVLGVFTFIVLLRPSVKALYDFSTPQA